MKFADAKFCKKHHDALVYIYYAKTLGPYMGSQYLEEYDLWCYRYRCHSDNCGKSVRLLDYENVMNTLMKLYYNVNDKAIKLRYGYQMVRLAHYKGHYVDAISNFYEYVEPLNLKTEIYYYALSQKAGAVRRVTEGYYYEGDCYEESYEEVAAAAEKAKQDAEYIEKIDKDYVLDFLTVFSKSHDMKFMAYRSLKNTGALETLFERASSLKKENKISLYFLLGYQGFSDPVNEIKKIVALDPNAEAARVLMVRYINNFERSYHHVDSLYIESCIPSSRIKEHSRATFNDALAIAERMTTQANDKNFWRMAAAALNAFDEKYETAAAHLRGVNKKDEMYTNTKGCLALYIDIMKVDSMTKNVADSIYHVHRSLFLNNGKLAPFNTIGNFNSNDRMLLQHFWAAKFAEAGDSVSSFLVYCPGSMKNIVSDLRLWDNIVALVNQPKHTDFEQWLIKQSGNLPMEQLNHIRAMIHLENGNFEEAYKLVLPDVFVEWKCALCSNIRGFNYYDPEEKNDFQYDYIKDLLGNVNLDSIPVKEYIGILVKLDKLRKANTEASAKAAFLLGNFFYNLSDEGYYRYRSCEAMGQCQKQTAAKFYMSGLKLQPDNELKARLCFGLAKAYEEGNRFYSCWEYNHCKDDSTDYLGYDKLKEMRNTNYYKTVISKCKYFEMYVNSF